MKSSFPKSLKTGEKYCFKTMEKFVYDENGRTVADHFKAVENSLNTQAANHNTLSSRVDNIIATDTSTENNSELIDTRVGYNGKQYDTVGTAVREQITDVYTAIKEIIKHTREVVPRDMNIYDAMYKHDDETMLYTDYVTFAYPSTVSVPAGYNLKVILYTYDETNLTYTQYVDSGWQTRYPIPKDTPMVIQLKHADGSNILETESIALMFDEEYPAIFKNSILEEAGFYDALQYKVSELDSAAFDYTMISTDKLITSASTMFVHAKKGYKCRIIRYHDDISGNVNIHHDSGWVDTAMIAANEPFIFAFSHDTQRNLKFENFVNNFTVEEIHFDNEYVNEVLRTVNYTGVIMPADQTHYVYAPSMGRLLSGVLNFPTPVTFYLDYNNPISIACHIPYASEPNIIEYNSEWGKVITVPANINLRLFFKHDTDTTSALDIKHLYELKATAGLVEESRNPHVKAIAHRGLAKYAPENTIHAFKYARLQGFEYVEADVSFTSDGVPVILHDDTIDRTSDGSGVISSLTYAAASAYDYGYSDKFGSTFAGTKLLTFEEFISNCRRDGVKPYIELKSSPTEAQIKSLINTVNKYGMLKNVTWISFNMNNLSIVKANNPYGRLGYLTSTLTSANVTTVSGLKTTTNEVFIDMDQYAVTNDVVTMCMNASLPLEIFTVDSLNEVENMNPYVSGVTSNWLQAGKYLMKVKS